ncbi:hypothetical protein [Halorussus sp. MSC15.2]|uniref:hypothetical protein n=1 Tax=Halorussus sp. MSC15.2 TaxID=2283638 RepID=UPI0013D061B7|nr:hypothetical protein [Halorussus sp. MSC15.2]NEU57150.1 hypothetical protein [Halorussus sp. MSC15.2]
MRLLHYSDGENGYDRPERAGRLAGCVAVRRDDKTVMTGTGETSEDEYGECPVCSSTDGKIRVTVAVLVDGLLQRLRAVRREVQVP